ncbi:hypothetical protein IW262DRAFT_1498175 [Armillaria fumosa]|nr:hypothetical protein IW262DRAFT_1498175 [Armillaria fumosa]
MVPHFILFSFCFATSMGFKFSHTTGNATVGTPFALTWYLDHSDDPDSLQLQQRLTSQNPGDGRPINFPFPDNGTSSGTVLVTFEVPGDHLVEVFQGDDEPPIATSNTIGVNSSESGTDPSSVSSSVSSTTSTSGASTSSANSSPGDPVPLSTSSTIPTSSNGMMSSTDQYTTSISLTYTQNVTMTTRPVVSTAPVTETTGLTSQLPSQPFVSPPSNESMTSSAAGSSSKTVRIVGATIGSFVFLLLLLVALMYTLRRRQWHHKQYPAIFHRDRMVRKRSNASFSPLTPTAKNPETYTNSVDVEKYASCNSTYKEDLAPSPQPQQGCLEYSLPAPLAPRSETPSPIPAHTDRQMEIYDVLVKKNTDLIKLKTELRRGGDVQEEIERLKATIKGLEEVLVSPWALGYTNEIPNEVSRVLVPN